MFEEQVKKFREYIDLILSRNEIIDENYTLDVISQRSNSKITLYLYLHNKISGLLKILSKSAERERFIININKAIKLLFPTLNSDIKHNFYKNSINFTFNLDTSTYFDLLPNELLIQIFDFVIRDSNLDDLINSSWNLATRINKNFWKTQYQYRYGPQKVDVDENWKNNYMFHDMLKADAEQEKLYMPEEFSIYRKIPRDESIYNQYKDYIDMANGLYTNSDLIGLSVCDLLDQLDAESFDQLNLERFDQKLVTPGVLLEYSKMFNIDISGMTEEQAANAIVQKAPCDWIHSVEQWARKNYDDEIKAINFYITDVMMIILGKLKEDIPLKSHEKEILDNLNKAIRRSPRPNEPFRVLRGVYLDPELNPGNIYRIKNNSSGSFSSSDVLQGYISSNSCIFNISIPAESILTYHPSEDQVIFPEGAQFIIVSGPYVEKYEPFDEPSYEITYDCTYMGPK